MSAELLSYYPEPSIVTKKIVALVVRTETRKSIRKSKIMIHIRVSSENFQFGQFLYFAYINRSLQSSIAIVALLASFLCHVKSFKCASYQIAKTIRPKICAKKRKKPKIQKVYRKLLVIAPHSVRGPSAWASWVLIGLWREGNRGPRTPRTHFGETSENSEHSDFTIPRAETFRYRNFCTIRCPWTI